MTQLEAAIAAVLANEGGYRKMALRFGVDEQELRAAVAERDPTRAGKAKKDRPTSPAPTPARAKAPEKPATTPTPDPDDHEPPQIRGLRAQLASLGKDMVETRSLMDLALAARPPAMTAASNMRKELNRLRELDRGLRLELSNLEADLRRGDMTDDQKRARVLMEELPRIVRYAPGFAEEMRRTLDRLLGVRLELVHDADREEVS